MRFHDILIGVVFLIAVINLIVVFLAISKLNKLKKSGFECNRTLINDTLKMLWISVISLSAIIVVCIIGMYFIYMRKITTAKVYLKNMIQGDKSHEYIVNREAEKARKKDENFIKTRKAYAKYENDKLMKKDARERAAMISNQKRREHELEMDVRNNLLKTNIKNKKLYEHGAGAQRHLDLNRERYNQKNKAQDDHLTRRAIAIAKIKARDEIEKKEMEEDETRSLEQEATGNRDSSDRLSSYNSRSEQPVSQVREKSEGGVFGRHFF